MTILVACVGNPFFGDDGFGPEVARALARRPLPEGVEVVDFGIRGHDLAHALMDGPRAVILVDALARGCPPGQLCVLDPELPEPGASPVDTHGMHPHRVLQMLRATGQAVPTMRVVGCEPEDIDEMREGLSSAVRAAVEPAAELVLSVSRALQEASGA